jgi:hypothetical protein
MFLKATLPAFQPAVQTSLCIIVHMHFKSLKAGFIMQFVFRNM